MVINKEKRKNTAFKYKFKPELNLDFIPQVVSLKSTFTTTKFVVNNIRLEVFFYRKILNLLNIIRSHLKKHCVHNVHFKNK